MSKHMHDEDAFWQDLLAKVAQAETPPDLTMEEAEQRMESAGEAPFSSEQLDAIVHSATAEEPQKGLWVVRSSAPAAPERRGFMARYGRGLTKVAALFLGLLLLYSVGQQFVGIEPRPTFAYTSAIETLIDSQKDQAVRLRNQVTVFIQVQYGIRTLKELGGQGGELESNADRFLGELRQLLSIQQPFEASDLVEQLDTLGTIGDTLLNPDNPMSQRLQAQRDLVDQVRGGILALKKAQLEASTSLLGMDIATSLDKLARELEN